ncbi:MAG TPA: c-type cytochrome biogenesis protein CcmI [Xanthobacteraceae bacterium]|nr:c-type cytochrome biogenesis protein CcmI [Xanthobacteraceae bacterium]
MLWIVLALMTLAALAAVLLPLRRRTSPAANAADPNDVAVYRDQLVEIERDKASGIIAPAEAEAARVEISRRLLAAADRMQGSAATIATGKHPRQRVAAATALLALPVGAIAFYLAIGSPGLPDEPLAARIAAAHNDNSVQALFARVEAHLEQHPDDGRGWEVIAPIYMDLGRYDDAVKARANALRLLGATAEREAYYGEALTAAANGVVTAEAKAAFDRAIDRDRRDPTARFYQGVAAEQDGSRADAERIWRALLADAPADAPWVPFVRQALARLEGAAAPAPAPGQTAGGAGDNEMIRGMVERLAERLRANGTDADGWVRLARSYKVLGDQAHMEAAIADARRALAGDAAKLAAFEDGLNNLAREPAAASAPSPAVAAPPAEAPAEQGGMIRGMVERLAERLRANGADADGWVRLARSYKVLGDQAHMEAAIADARRALAADAAKLAAFEDGLNNLAREPAAAPAPSPAVAAAPAEAPAAPDGMIRGMVERLAARLRQDGSDVNGWIMLVRSYLVLGERDRAEAAAAAARAAIGAKPDDRRRLDEGLQGLGVRGDMTQQGKVQ